MGKSPYEMVDTKIDALSQIEGLVASGMKVSQSVQIIAHTTGISIRTLFRCRNLTNFLPREKWRDALAWKWPRAKCHPAAVKEFVELCRSGIGVSESYRRTLALSKAERWGPVPSEQVMRRQLTLYIAPAEIRRVRRVEKGGFPILENLMPGAGEPKPDEQMTD